MASSRAGGSHGIMAVVFGLLSVLHSPFADGATGELRGGAAVRSVTPRVSARDAPVPLAGFGHDRIARAVHDDVTVRALTLDQDGVSVALVAVDVVGLFAPQARAIQAMLDARPGDLPHVELFLCATHTHAGPDTMGLWGRLPWVNGASRNYLRCLREAVLDCVLEARAASRPVRVRVATADVTDLIRDTRPPEVIDGTMIVLSLEGEDGACIATLTEVSSHPEVLWGDNTILSADFPYFLRRMIESERGGVAVHVSGAIGGLMTPRRIELIDPLSGRPAPRGSLRACELYGEALARRALGALAQGRRLVQPRLRAERMTISIPLDNVRFRLARTLGVIGRDLRQGRVLSEVGVIDLGRVQMVAVPGELYPELWLGGSEHPRGADLEEPGDLVPLRSLLPGPQVLILGLCNDELGYIIPPGQWDREPPYTYGRQTAPYGEVNSVGPAAATEIAAGLRAIAERMDAR